MDLVDLDPRAERIPAPIGFPRLLARRGNDALAVVYLLQLGADAGSRVETVDSIDPRYPRSEKSVIILSTQYGCPVGCAFCDAAGDYHGNPDAAGLLAQVRFVLERRPEILSTRKLKVHFARMGEPALNARAVLEALDRLPELLPNPGLLPCVATVTPAAAPRFLLDLFEVVSRRYRPGCFQLQLSINATDPAARRRLVPIPTLPLETLGELAAPFHRPGDRRVVLNFALARGVTVELPRLLRAFDPTHFMVKLTPVNPTLRARAGGFETLLEAGRPHAADALLAELEAAGYETVVSIGDPEEIAIGSNCGQLARALLRSPTA
jgi:23S rRNA (adenine2503-C2)-methyltransferase